MLPDGATMPEPSLVGLLNGKIQRILDLARRHLDMDVAYVAEFAGGKQVFRAVDGDAESFEMTVGDGPELGTTYCKLMSAGQLPKVVPDSAAEPLVRHLPATIASRIGSYIGVPLHLSDGTTYGTFCCLSHDAESLDERDVRFMTMLAEVIVDELDDQHRLDQARARIADVISARSLQIAYQPLADLGDGSCLGIEALSRFPSGLGPPDVVIDTAHQVGLGLDLELLAVRQAVSFLDRLPAQHFLAVNLTPTAAFQLARREYRAEETPILRRLVLEITETAAVEAYDGFRERLAPLRERGLRLAIDDAGAGYASLHHIVELEPDIIKIDRALVDGLATDRYRRGAAHAFVTLGADLGATVVAEGVDDVAALEAARELGIDAAQGYLLARPSTDPAVVAGWFPRVAGPHFPEALSVS
jgi:EAL domain-containing protein (putative c-di-GMP-specific phosphodiesterase class I)